MTVVVLVPHRADSRERAENWNRVCAEWQRTGLNIHVCDHEGEPFSRSRALNEGAQAAGSWNVALVTDSDLLLADTERQANEAIKHARAGYYAVAYSVIQYLDRRATERVVRGGRLSPELAYWQTGSTWGGVFALPRDLWYRIDGFDERFIGWGGEDVAFHGMARTYVGAKRVEGDVYHLDHPLVRDDDHPQTRSNMILAKRYAEATHNVRAMNAILKERQSG